MDGTELVPIVWSRHKVRNANCNEWGWPKPPRTLHEDVVVSLSTIEDEAVCIPSWELGVEHITPCTKRNGRTPAERKARRAKREAKWRNYSRSHYYRHDYRHRCKKCDECLGRDLTKKWPNLGRPKVA